MNPMMAMMGYGQFPAMPGQGGMAKDGQAAQAQGGAGVRGMGAGAMKGTNMGPGFPQMYAGAGGARGPAGMVPDYYQQQSWDEDGRGMQGMDTRGKGGNIGGYAQGGNFMGSGMAMPAGMMPGMNMGMNMNMGMGVPPGAAHQQRRGDDMGMRMDSGAAALLQNKLPPSTHSTGRNSPQNYPYGNNASNGSNSPSNPPHQARSVVAEKKLSNSGGPASPSSPSLARHLGDSAFPADAGAGPRSSLLEEFRNIKNKKFELQDIMGHIVEFSGDQHGSRYFPLALCPFIFF